MEEYEYEEEEGGSKKWLRALLFLVVAGALIAGGIWAGKTFFGGGAGGADSQPGYQSALEAARAGKAIGYATGVVATDPETLQDQVDEMRRRSKEPGLSLEYKNEAYSQDGRTFACYIGNSAKNVDDMFITIYADPELTDILFLSELLVPGTRFEEITLERKLEPGRHEAYLVHTQVKENQEDPALLQEMTAQIATTFTLVVEGAE